MAELLTNKASTYSSLTNWNANYPTDYTNDLSVKDYLDKTILKKELICIILCIIYILIMPVINLRTLPTFLESILELLREIPLLL